MKTRKRELAKAGIFGSADNPIIVTEKDLREIAETFPDQKTAPVQFGHWADAASPRLGNVVSVSYDEKEKSLTGEIEEHDVLFDAVEQGFFPDVSIGAKKRASDGKMYLHHLAYLGEEPRQSKTSRKASAMRLTMPLPRRSPRQTLHPASLSKCRQQAQRVCTFLIQNPKRRKLP